MSTVSPCCLLLLFAGSLSHALGNDVDSITLLKGKLKMVDATPSLRFTTGLRGFHVYSTTKGWKPYLKQKITFKIEHNNIHDRFAVSGSVTLRGTLAPVVVSHVPRELSRYVWYALGKGAKFTGEVISVKAKRSPLVQGGLEIPVSVVVQWSDARSLAILKEKTEEVSYSIEKDNVDDSKSILSEIQEADVYVSDSDSDEEAETL